MHYSPLAASPRLWRVDVLAYRRIHARFATSPRQRRVDALAPRRISARFAASPRQRRVDVAPLGEYMCRRHMAETQKAPAFRASTKPVPSVFRHMLRMCSPRGNAQKKENQSSLEPVLFFCLPMIDRNLFHNSLKVVSSLKKPFVALHFGLRCRFLSEPYKPIIRKYEILSIGFVQILFTNR